MLAFIHLLQKQTRMRRGQMAHGILCEHTGMASALVAESFSHLADAQRTESASPARSGNESHQGFENVKNLRTTPYLQQHRSYNNAAATTTQYLRQRGIQNYTEPGHGETQALARNATTVGR